MTMLGRRSFCRKCGKETGYLLKKMDVIKTVKDKEYTFEITMAVCGVCGEELRVPDLAAQSEQEMDEQYRSAEGLVSIEDIERLMKIYRIGKAPLSLALGFGEITIPRYLEGQVPSREYSDVVRATLSSPTYMKRKLMENKDKLTDAAYRKAISAADDMESLFSLSDKLTGVIAYLFREMGEISPVMLQNLLYFIQGVYSALYGKPVFDEDCRARAEGPVYPAVYELFRDFLFNPVEDARFALFEGAEAVLTEEEKRVVSLVANTFGIYGGKVLKQITRKETPWKEAREGYDDGIPSDELMPKERIMEYYENVDRKYGINTEDGINTYISDIQGV